jgi:hypothetical protein
LLFSQIQVRFGFMPIPLVDFTGIGENATDIVLRLKTSPRATARPTPSPAKFASADKWPRRSWPHPYGA